MKDIKFDISQKGSLIKRIEKIERTLTALQNSSVKANSLDEIADDLGLITSGAFWATQTSGAPTDPEFTGVFMDSYGHTFGTDTYQFGGATGGTLQWGGRLSDATLTAGAGNVMMNADGVEVNAAGLGIGITVPPPVNSYKSKNADGDVVGYIGWGSEDGDSNRCYLYTNGFENEEEVAEMYISARGYGYTSADISLASSSAGGVITIGGSGQILSSDGVIYSGTYTPTLTNTTNIDASTANVCQYMRVGQVVTVSGRVTIDPTASGSATVLGVTFPIASTISGANQCAGTFSKATGSVSGVIYGDTTNNRATFSIISDTTANAGYLFTFTYLIS